MRHVIAPVDVVRGAIARSWMGDDAPHGEPAMLGDVVLRPHQRRAVVRLRQALARDGGALLADAVGLGKTYVALALAREARRPLVVAPAVLRATWQRAAARCGVSVSFLSIETLSRREPSRDEVRDGPDLLVVDEAHHARNPATRRWRGLAALAEGARVLLLTATPVHNATRDLRAILSLFLGARADRLGGDALLRLVVRRRHGDVASRVPDVVGPGLPSVHRAPWRVMPADAAVGGALAAIPTPLPTAGGGTGGALWRLGLVRAWASSDGALRAALRRRLVAAAALESALAAGRLPTRHELRAWSGDEDAVQLAFPAMVTDTVAADDDAARWRAVVGAHAAGVRAALAVLAARPDRDARRVTWLRALRRRHDGATIVVFTHSADTARALYRHLVRDGAVALLTATGGRVAGGTLGRAELLARAAPHAAGLPPPPAAERVTLLLATDCLSEGLDLRDASVIVHLDVPWTPARLAQRVGRAARLGSSHAVVAVHGLAPSASVRRWLRLGARLRVKAGAARRAVGAGERAVSLGRLLERWAAEAPDAVSDPAGGPLVAVVSAPRNGFLAACVDARGPLLVAGGVHGVSGTTLSVWRATRRAARRPDTAVPDGVTRDVAPPDDVGPALDVVRRRIARWHRAARAEQLAGLARDEAPGVLARALVARAETAVRRAPAHRRPAVAVLAAELRAALQRPLPAALEALLCTRLAEPPDERWLADVAARVRIRPAHESVAPDAREREGALRVVAVILFRPSLPSGGAGGARLAGRDSAS